MCFCTSNLNDNDLCSSIAQYYENTPKERIISSSRRQAIKRHPQWREALLNRIDQHLCPKCAGRLTNKQPVVLQMASKAREQEPETHLQILQVFQKHGAFDASFVSIQTRNCVSNTARLVTQLLGTVLYKEKPNSSLPWSMPSIAAFFMKIQPEWILNGPCPSMRPEYWYDRDFRNTTGDYIDSLTNMVEDFTILPLAQLIVSYVNNYLQMLQDALNTLLKAQKAANQDDKEEE
jgi:hypothetical protein